MSSAVTCALSVCVKLSARAGENAIISPFSISWISSCASSLFPVRRSAFSSEKTAKSASSPDCCSSSEKISAVFLSFSEKFPDCLFSEISVSESPCASVSSVSETTFCSCCILSVSDPPSSGSSFSTASSISGRYSEEIPITVLAEATMEEPEISSASNVPVIFLFNFFFLLS